MRQWFDSTPAFDSEVPKAGDMLNWSVERGSWPHAEASSFHQAAGLRWHVQQMGQGPPMVLVHGTGASTHSWRQLSPLLAEHFTVIAMDLPGHGFTQCPSRRRLSLPGMAEAVAALIASLGVRPAVVVGHSAGAAILIRCCLDRTLNPASVISLNGALLPFRGAAGVLFPRLAKLLFLNPLTPRILARSAADRERVNRVIRGTGSELDAEGIELYRRLFANPEHVAAALGMMAHWDLHAFERDLPKLQQRLLLIAGEKDKAVDLRDAEQVAGRMAGARLLRLSNLGHLAHEEAPVEVARIVFDLAVTR